MREREGINYQLLSCFIHDDPFNNLVKPMKAAQLFILLTCTKIITIYTRGSTIFLFIYPKTSYPILLYSTI